MSNYTLACSDCSLWESIPEPQYKYIYKFNHDEQIPISTNCCWCDKCNRVTESEVLLHTISSGKKVFSHPNSIKILQDAHRNLQNICSSNALNFHLKGLSLISSIQKKLSSKIVALEKFKDRTSSERCLECGNTTIVQIPIYGALEKRRNLISAKSNQYIDENTGSYKKISDYREIETDTMHLNCTGNFMIIHTPDPNYGAPEIIGNRFYDVDGTELTD